MFTKKSRILAHNMQILRPTVDCALNLLPWTALAFIVFAAWMTGLKHDYYYILSYQVVTITILKCAIIAGKYGNFDHQQIEQICNRYMTVRELDSQHMLASWAEQSSDTVFRNIDNSMRKSNFDDSNFFVSFVTHPRSFTLKALQEAELEEAKFYARSQKRLQMPVETFKKTVDSYPYDKSEKIKLQGKTQNTV
jgi:hypothetical protein